MLGTDKQMNTSRKLLLFSLVLPLEAVFCAFFKVDRFWIPKTASVILSLQVGRGV